ncbi:unnamed protein product [Arabidopsis arenosa]|uniref:FBD domain-containing protein n=1 Tax=Arabidopsis arenosa TaxID=38785 RepID=A0A8S1ZEL1_ARAAE|nr:unnamed protein product [Arabidopsis arenosa]
MLPDEDVSLPSLKTLFLDRICFYNTGFCVLGKLLSASPLLEELTILCPSWQYGSCCRNVSSSTLKKLTIISDPQLEFWDLVFDTPTKLDLSLCRGISNPTNLIMGLTNVEVLELSSVDTSKMFYHFREAIPFPILLMSSPNLHTLVIKGPLHADEWEPKYRLSCPVKVLKITEYGGKRGELKRMKHLLEKLSCLELVKVCACAINDNEKSRITKDLLMVPRSFNCNIQVKSSEKTNMFRYPTLLRTMPLLLSVVTSIISTRAVIAAAMIIQDDSSYGPCTV